MKLEINQHGGQFVDLGVNISQSKQIKNFVMDFYTLFLNLFQMRRINFLWPFPFNKPMCLNHR